MLFSDMTISIILVLLASVMLVVTGLKKQPGLGIIGTLIVIGLALWLRGDNLPSLGFSAPDSWPKTILLGLILGLLIQLVSVALIEPLTEKMTGTAHDHSIIDNVKGNWIAFFQWVLVVWVLVAFIEESIFRGFLMTEITKITGKETWALILNILFSSLVFGLSHGYQNRAGIWSTATIGILLAWIFVFSDFNLWLAIFTHGFIDTVGIALIAVDGDKTIRQKIWKDNSSPR
jgi:membrane protease YdiL (CAAX protease family)